MPPTPPPSAERRAAYAAELAQGTDRFHEPRREDCPWCGSKRLRTRLRTPDQVQRKPGTFVVDECADCSHAFQNPRLSAEGLAFYHRDFHEGLDGLTDRLLGARGSRGRHRAAARALLRHAEPESWLDVGTGHGHFPAVAREVHPYTSFDGLDPTRRVEKARAAGHIEEAHRGRLHRPPDHRAAERPLRRGEHVPPSGAHPRPARGTARRPDGPAARRSPPRRSAGPRLRVRRAAGQVVGVVRPAAPSAPDAAVQPAGRTGVPRLRDRRDRPPRTAHPVRPRRMPSRWPSAASCPTSTPPGAPPRRPRSSAPCTRSWPGRASRCSPRPPPWTTRWPRSSAAPASRTPSGSSPADNPEPRSAQVGPGQPRNDSACPATTSSTCSHSAANPAFRRPSSSR